VDERQVLDQLSEEQREELNEAVSLDTSSGPTMQRITSRAYV
jgi:hypothetical protein